MSLSPVALSVAKQPVSRNVAANHQPENGSIELSFKSYLEAFSGGTKVGLIDISETDQDFLLSAPPYRGKDLETMDLQGELLLNAVQASSATECTKLGVLLGSETAATFRDRTLQGHREFEAKRAEYCARVPKPKNCH